MYHIRVIEKTAQARDRSRTVKLDPVPNLNLKARFPVSYSNSYSNSIPAA
jgi:hypothetical protein